MESSILESIGVEIIGVMTPVSICMLLVVLLVYALTPSSPDPTPFRTAATLVYLESPSDSTTQKLEGALLNAAVFVILIAAVTFLLVVLYYYNFSNFLKNYMRFSAFFVLGSMGGSIFLSIIQHFSIPIDSITSSVLLFNFTIVGVLSIFSRGFPIFLRQGYMVLLGIIVATWFTKLPEWTTWVLLVALAVYDLVAVLAPGGPLKLLVEMASSRDEELPALVYEARPVVSSSPGGRRSTALGLLVASSSESGSVELQPVGQNNGGRNDTVLGNRINSDRSPVEPGNRQADETNSNIEDEISPLVAHSGRRRSTSTEVSNYSTVDIVSLQARISGNAESENAIEEEMSPLVELLGLENEREQTRMNSGNGHDMSMTTTPGIKLGLGDFVFYSVLVGRAAMYDLMTVYACYLAIISGLGCTLILLAVCHRALPALPISITLGVMFYFLTRLLMEPFVVGTSTNLMMF
ncbi:PREDICTED: presenilin-like protein At1g08700 [Nelumbo nucifera]|uniref:Presenilin n=2 Tax=Nelumbo nucifera TaxID=4432 RepID=A0A822YAE2_NELNU|nr:PREDICTED: presenilin-like protein At1g08700 [Nelumbo nucifera]DAD29272.1 TPA_asm: hypothetical protein HUJ06_030740 [Nelumbo nucifera]